MPSYPYKLDIFILSPPPHEMLGKGRSTRPEPPLVRVRVIMRGHPSISQSTCTIPIAGCYYTSLTQFAYTLELGEGMKTHQRVVKVTEQVKKDTPVLQRSQGAVWGVGGGVNDGFANYYVIENNQATLTTFGLVVPRVGTRAENYMLNSYSARTPFEVLHKETSFSY